MTSYRHSESTALDESRDDASESGEHPSVRFIAAVEEPVVVMKFGGTSVADLERIREVAKRCVAARRAGNRVVVVVSAMAGETNRLLALAHGLSKAPDARELDALAATGEQVTAALTAVAIRELGEEAVSFLGHQIPIRTDDAYTRARIEAIDPARIEGALARGAIAVVAGFQGVDAAGNITTIGRGGSDTTAVAVAAALRASACEIYTDVDGVYESDPSACRGVRRLDALPPEEMLEMASLGAKVLQTRSVEIAMNHGVDVHVRSTFAERDGTWVRRHRAPFEALRVTGITCDRSESRVLVRGAPASEEAHARVLDALASSHVPIDMVVVAPRADGRADVAFSAPTKDVERHLRRLEQIALALGAQLACDHDVAKVSVVGVGLRSYACLTPRLLRVCARSAAPVRAMMVNETRASLLVAAARADAVVGALHAELFRPQHAAG